MIHEAFHKALLFLFLLILLKVSAIHDCLYSWPCVSHVILLKALWEAKLYQTLGGKTLPNIFGSRVGHPKNKQSRAITSNSRAITAAGTWRCAGVVAAVVVVVVVAAVAVLYFFTSFLLFFFTNWFTSWQQLVITNKRISPFHGISYHELVVTCGNGFHAREIPPRINLMDSIN